MKTACDMIAAELAEYAEEKFGKLQKFLALEPDRLDHRDLLIRTVEEQIQGLHGAVDEYLARPDLLADPELGPAMLAVIQDFNVLEEILKRARAAGKERGLS